jgi:hypothetical protein
LVDLLLKLSLLSHSHSELESQQGSASLSLAEEKNLVKRLEQAKRDRKLVRYCVT